MSGTCADRTVAEPGPSQRALAGLGRFFASVGFPLFALSLLAAVELWLLAMLLFPGGDSGLGAFADEFRVWCFGYDPATGELEWAYTAMLFADPLVLGALIAALWYRPLKRSAARIRRVALPLLAAALAAVAALSFGLLSTAEGPKRGVLPFPAEALRTSFTPPEIDLENQDGSPVTLRDLRGKVVVVTGVYASCGHTCPLLMAQATRALAALAPAERAQIRVLAVTLNPEFDTREVLAAARDRYRVSSPEFQFLTGEPPIVHEILDALQIARVKNPHSGAIDHSNLFILVDKQGKIAYRLTLGERQERWLISALQLLSREPFGGGA